MSHALHAESELFVVDVTGDMAAGTRQFVRDKIRSLATYAHRPILHAHVVVETSANPASGFRFQTIAHLDVSGAPVNGKAVGATLREAVDVLRQRLYAQPGEH